MGSNSIVVAMNKGFQLIDSHLIHSIASFFEAITRKNSIRSITIFGYKRGINQDFFNHGRFLVEFESPSVCFEAKSSCNRLIILNLAEFGGRKISHLVSYEFIQQCLRHNNRPDYDKVKFVKIGDSWQLETQNGFDNTLNEAIQPFSGTNTITSNPNINIFRSVISHSNISTNNNLTINNNNNNNVLASEFSGGISNQAIQPQPLIGAIATTASNAHINISRSLNAHPSIATNNNLTINNNTVQPSGEIQEAQFVITQFNKILNESHFSEEHVKALIANKLSSKDNEDLSISETYILTLVCPITHKRLINPARSLNCLHLESFELESFIKLNASSCRWQCPICKSDASISKLRVDTFLMKVLNECQADKVEISKDSKWVVLDVNNNSTKGITKDFYDLTNENFNDTIYLSDDSFRENIGSQKKELSINPRPLQTNNTPRRDTSVVQNQHPKTPTFFWPITDARHLENLNDKENRSLLTWQNTNPQPNHFHASTPHNIINHQQALTRIHVSTTAHIVQTRSTILSSGSSSIVDKSICEICSRKYASERGKKQHIRMTHKLI